MIVFSSFLFEFIFFYELNSFESISLSGISFNSLKFICFVFLWLNYFVEPVLGIVNRHVVFVFWIFLCVLNEIWFILSIFFAILALLESISCYSLILCCYLAFIILWWKTIFYSYLNSPLEFTSKSASVFYLDRIELWWSFFIFYSNSSITLFLPFIFLLDLEKDFIFKFVFYKLK